MLAYGELNPGNAAKIILKMCFTHLVEGECYGVCFSFLFYVNFKMDNFMRSVLNFKTSILKIHFQEREEYIEMNIKNIKVFMVERYMGMERQI